MLTKSLSVGLAISIISGAMWVGALAGDVKDLTEAEKRRLEDHDTLIELKSEQKTVKDDVAEIKRDVKDLDDKLDKILAEVRKK